MGNMTRGAIVLAGGRSLRMGDDKAGLRLAGETMLSRVVTRLRETFEEIVIVAGPNSVVAPEVLISGSRLVRDLVAFEGPVSALRMGLETIRAGVGFACACDLPFLSPSLAAAVCAMSEGHQAAIPLVEGRLQMLQAAYRRSCVQALDDMIGRADRQLNRLVDSIDARIVGEDEMRAYDPELISFLNVNTPADYARAQRLISATKSSA